MGLGALSLRYRRHGGRYLGIILVAGFACLFSGLLYSAAAYAPITLHYDLNGNLDQRGDSSPRRSD